MKTHEIENSVSQASDTPTLAPFGLKVHESMTTPSRPGKTARSVWVVSGNIFGLEEFFREIKGRKFRGSWSFFEDPSGDILDFLQNSERLSYAEQVERSIERRLEKAERYESYAANAEARAERSYKVASAIGSAIPLGQPILVGHHSERRHRRDLGRIERNMQKSIEEGKRAEYFSGKADRLARAEAKLESREFVGNRIADAKKEVTQLSRWAEPHNPRLVQAQAKLAYWQNRLAVIEAKQKEEGHAIASPETVKVGDLVWYIGRWLPVARVNKKTVTVSHWLGVPTLTYKIEYTRIQKFQSKPSA